MRALIAIALLTLFGAGEAAAASCGQLRAQLAAAQSGGGASASVRQQYAAYGCSSSSAWGRHRACGSLERQMRGGGASAGRIRALQSQVAAACASEQRQATRRAPAGGGTAMVGGRVVAGAAPANAAEPRGDGGFFGNLFGRRRVVEDGDVRTVRAAPRAIVGPVERLDMDEARGRRRTPRNDADDNNTPKRSEVDIAAVARDSGGKRLREGNTQTVCVRLCDGFYFPINNHSTTANFYEELAMCVGRCPGADVSLYAHGAGSSVEGMRSTLTNERYTDLPTAFVYRKGLSPDCGCHAKSVVAGDLDADKTLAAIGLDAPPAATPVSAAGGATAGTPAGGSADAALASAAPPRPSVPLLRAVLDETGKPLPPRLTARTVVDGELRSATAQLPIVAAHAREAERAFLPRTGPAPLRLREVGPQFFVESEAQERASQRRRHATVVTTTAVRVVPVTPDAGLASDPDDAAAPAGEAPSEPQDVGGFDPSNAGDAAVLDPDARPAELQDVGAPDSVSDDAAALDPDARPAAPQDVGALALSSDG